MRRPLDSILNSTYLNAIRTLASFGAIVLVVWGDSAKPLWRPIAIVLLVLVTLSLLGEFVASQIRGFGRTFGERQYQRWIDSADRQSLRRIANDSMARLYTYELVEQDIRIAVSDQGGATVRRLITLRAYDTVSEILHYVVPVDVPGLPKPEGSGSSGWTYKARILKPSDTIDIKIEPVSQGASAKGLQYRCEFRPNIRKDETVVYEITETIPRGQILTTSQALVTAKIEKEWVAWHLYEPTRKLRLQVSIPDQLLPTAPSFNVWYDHGSNRHQHRAEFEDCEQQKDTLTEAHDSRRNRTVYALNRAEPLLGLLYAVRWDYNDPSQESGVSTTSS